MDLFFFTKWRPPKARPPLPAEEAPPPLVLELALVLPPLAQALAAAAAGEKASTLPVNPFFPAVRVAGAGGRGGAVHD